MPMTSASSFESESRGARHPKFMSDVFWRGTREAMETNVSRSRRDSLGHAVSEAETFRSAGRQNRTTDLSRQPLGSSRYPTSSMSIDLTEDTFDNVDLDRL